jgi:hypothetical protein
MIKKAVFSPNNLLMTVNNLLITRLLTKLFKNHKLVVRFIKDTNSLIDNNGVPYTIRYMKAVKLHITRLMCGQPLKVNKALVSIDADYFPSKFSYLKVLLNGSYNDKRLLLSLLSYSRSIKPQKKTDLPEPDYSTITDKSSGDGYTIPKKFIQQFVEYHRLKLARPK